MSEPQSAGSAMSFREQVHQMLRGSILDAAWARATDADWDAVRIADIAKDVGVSRQTIYNEFGTKQQLAEAVFDREMNAFLSEIVEVSRRADTLEGALRESLIWMFEASAAHPMLQRMIRDARDGNSTSLLPLMTTNAHLVIRPMRAILTEVYHERWEGDRGDVERLADFVVRLGISHILSESDYSIESVVEEIVHIVTTVIRSRTHVEP